MSRNREALRVAPSSARTDRSMLGMVLAFSLCGLLIRDCSFLFLGLIIFVGVIAILTPLFVAYILRTIIGFRANLHCANRWNWPNANWLARGSKARPRPPTPTSGSNTPIERLLPSAVMKLTSLTVTHRAYFSRIIPGRGLLHCRTRSNRNAQCAAIIPRFWSVATLMTPKP